jgi:hypothetical protein
MEFNCFVNGSFDDDDIDRKVNSRLRFFKIIYLPISNDIEPLHSNAFAIETSIYQSIGIQSSTACT